MKKVIINFILVLVLGFQTISCQVYTKNAEKEDDFIPYVLPVETEQALYNELKPLLLKPFLFGIAFEFTQKGTIEVYINVFRNGYDVDHNLTNRKVFVNDTFYPLVFKLDRTFDAISKGGFPMWNITRNDPKNKRNSFITEEKIPSLKERKDKAAVYRREYILSHNTPIFKMNLKGNIVD